MKIETKFNPGDDVFLLRDNTVIIKKIESLKVYCFHSPLRHSTKYKFDDSGMSYTEEKHLFKTKQELIESL